MACNGCSVSFLNDEDNALDGYIDCQYMLDVGSGLLPNILIGIRERPSELLFICIFWVQKAFFKHTEFCLGHLFFSSPTQTHWKSYDSCQTVRERLRKNTVGLMSYLEKSVIPIHRQLCRPRWGIWYAVSGSNTKV